MQSVALVDGCICMGPLAASRSRAGGVG